MTEQLELFLGYSPLVVGIVHSFFLETVSLAQDRYVRGLQHIVLPAERALDSCLSRRVWGTYAYGTD